MVRSIILILVILALFTLGQASWSSSNHQYSPEVSAKIATAIKEKLLKNIDKITNTQEAKALKADLNQQDDSERKLKSISALTANQIFGILLIPDPKCDQNGDGKIRGDQLKCLNLIWKAYVPH